MFSRLAVAWLLASLVCTGVAVADTTVTGVITADTTWQTAQSPYLVTSDVTITAGATLTIEPGVSVYVSQSSNLIVSSGAIQAKGTAQSPIRISSHKARGGGVPAMGDWGQVRFLSGTNGKTIIEHVQIEYGSGIVVNGASPVFNFVDIRNCAGAAVTLDLAASPTGVGVSASDNQINAIAVPAGEILGNVNWGIRGIPYAVLNGLLSVGVAPQAIGVNPATIEQGTSATVTVSGSRLAGASSASFSTSGLSASVIAGGTASQTVLSVTAAADAALGATDLKLQVDAGDVSVSPALTVVAPQPAITGLNPASVYVGQGPVPLDIAGRNFVPNTEVLVNGNAVPTTVLGPTQLRIALGNQVSPGSLSLKARVPDQGNAGQYLTSSAVSLAVQMPQLLLSPVNARLIIGGKQNFAAGIPFAAPAGGYVVNLASGAASVATVPPNVTIPEGASSANFDLTAATAGNTSLTASHAGAVSVQVPITVVPVQSLTLLPSTIIVTPGSSGDKVTLKLGYADVVDYTFNVATDDPVVALISPASITIPAGQTTATVTVSGVTAGTTILRAASAGGLTASRPVYVSDEVTGTLTVDGPALPLALAPGQKARVSFAGGDKQLLGITVAGMATVPANGSLTIYVDRADGTTIGTCPFSGGDVCHLNALPAAEAYTLRVMPNGIYAANLSIQVVTELTGLPTSGPMGPIMAPSVGIQRGTMSANGGAEVVVALPVGIQRGMMSADQSKEVVASPAVGIQRGNFFEYDPAASLTPRVVSPAVGILRGDYMETFAAGSIGPTVVTRPVHLTK